MSAPTAQAHRAGTPALARTALLLLPLHVVGRGGEALLPLFLAAWFGRTAQTDLYYLLAAYFVFAGALLTGAFQDSAVVPVLIEVEGAGPGPFAEVAGALLGHTLAIGAGVAVVTGALAAAAALAFSSAPGQALTLIALLSAAVVAVSARSFYVGLMNSRRVFRAHPIASGAGMALTYAVLAGAAPRFGVAAIPLGTLAGESLAVVLLAWLARQSLGHSVVPTLARPEAMTRILRLVRLEVTGSVITRINPVVDQLMAGMAGVVGGGTVLRYANDVASLPTSVLQATLFPVLLTRLSQESTDPERFAATTRRTLGWVVALLVAAATALALLRTPLSELLFARGAMDRAGAAQIAAVVPWSLAGAAPFGALLVLARAHVARQNSRIMPSMGILNSTLNAALNLVFVRWIGLPGIALSTSVTYLVVAVVFWIRLPRGARA